MIRRDQWNLRFHGERVIPSLRALVLYRMIYISHLVIGAKQRDKSLEQLEIVHFQTLGIFPPKLLRVHDTRPDVHTYVHAHT